MFYKCAERQVAVQGLTQHSFELWVASRQLTLRNPTASSACSNISPNCFRIDASKWEGTRLWRSVPEVWSFWVWVGLRREAFLEFLEAVLPPAASWLSDSLGSTSSSREGGGGGAGWVRRRRRRKYELREKFNLNLGGSDFSKWWIQTWKVKSIEPLLLLSSSATSPLQPIFFSKEDI